MVLTLLLGLAAAGELNLSMSADDFVLTADTERGVKRVMGRMFAAYDGELGLTYPNRTAMRVRLIENRAAYDAAARGIGVTQPTLGFFSTRTGEGVVWRNTSESEMRATLVHEASHFLMARGGAIYAPRWLHEGMATLFGHARLAGNAVYLDPPAGIGRVLQGMNDAIPEVEVLLGNPRAWAQIPATASHGPADYSVGWAICAFLMRNDRGKAVLAELLKTRPGPAMVAVVAKRWPGGLRAFDQAWRRWWANPQSIQLPIRAATKPVDGGWIRCDNGTLIRADSGMECPKRL
ncbi:MAG: hypothetical protein AAGA48_20335 [Myxococcota bacterium]